MAKRFLLLLFLVVMFAPSAWAQQFYQWKDRKGLWNFSNNRPAGVTEEQVKIRFYPPTPVTSGDPYNRGYQEGYGLGYQQGYKEYYKKRYEEGREQGFKEGYHAWRSEKATVVPRSVQ
jgi:hypothetical protein